MKEKLLKQLKPLLADKGLSKDELESLAEIAAKNLTDESTEEDVNNVIDSVKPYVDLMQRVGNRYATTTEKKFKGWVKPEPKEVENATANTEPKKEVESNQKPFSAEEIAKLIEQQVSERMKPFEQAAEAKRLRSLLDSNEKVKSIPEAFRRNYTLDKEEDLDDLANRIETDYTALKQELVKSGEFVTPPERSDAGGDNDDLINQLQAMTKETK